MRFLKRNNTFTILGSKVGNTYIRSNNGKCYPISNKTFTKSHKDYEEAFWLLKRNYFQYKIIGVIKPC